MQTFLPNPNFTESAKILDWRRLGKERVEVVQLLRCLTQGPNCLYDKISKEYVYGEIPENPPFGLVIAKTPWYNHPAARMWRGHEGALCLYGLEFCKEWVRRGYKDNVCYDKICNFLPLYSNSDSLANPPWIGNSLVHGSHRANLKRKDPKYYGQFNWAESPEEKYFWPV